LRELLSKFITKLSKTKHRMKKILSLALCLILIQVLAQKPPQKIKTPPPVPAKNKPTGTVPPQKPQAELIDDVGPEEKPVVSYQLSMEAAPTHYFDVAMDVSGYGQKTKSRGYIDFKMAAWTPGSYLIREYARHVEGFEASSEKGNLKAEKISKNTWRVFLNESQKVKVSYKVYAFEISVRTSFLDDTHGYINPASVFMYVHEWRNMPSTLNIKPYKDWKNISTGLLPIKGKENFFEIPNLDIFIDSPIEIGNHKILSFELNGVPHKAAFYGEATIDYNKLMSDMQKTCEAATKVFGELPIKDYTFITHWLMSGGGGLEHLNSTTLQFSRLALGSDRGYKAFLGLVAHEYFHLWNVKRLRPSALGPFDYENENYTHSLWLSEGCTSFYQNYILRRAGFYTPEAYLDVIATDITNVENTPGNKIQSVAESSWDAWIKYYRPHENSKNATVSYYDKGDLMGTILNLSIIEATKGEKNFDDLFKFMYKKYYKEQNRGFTDAELLGGFEAVTGKPFKEFFEKYIFGTESIDYNKYFNVVGVQLIDKNAGSQQPFLGINLSPGKMSVATTVRNSPAYNAGISVGDDIVEIDDTRPTDLNSVIAGKKIGDVLKIKVMRQGLFRMYEVKLVANPTKAFKLEKIASPSSEQEKLYKRWMFSE
jgi:predicted metalloprotease with PDZ domain